MKISIFLSIVIVLASCSEESNQIQDDSSQFTNNIVDQISEELEMSDTSAVVEDVLEVIEETICETKFSVYISDPGEPFTNVRNAPAGEIVMALPHSDEMEDYMLTIVAVNNGWYKFESPIFGTNDDVTVPGGFGWVHHSVVATDTRNYGGQVISLYAAPDEESKVEGTIEIESGGLKVLDACNDWVLIELEYEGYYRKGWMKTEWVCGNPFTNCS